MILHTAVRWGVDDIEITYVEKERILHAASRQAVYDDGYNRKSSLNNILCWKSKILTEISNGVLVSIGINGYCQYIH